MKRIILILDFIFVLITCSRSPQKFPSPNIGPKIEENQFSEYQKILYVSATTGSDEDGDGSFQKPWKLIHFALSQINDATSNNRYAILVSQGIYGHETIRMKEYVDLYGGFEPSQWQRNIFRFRTILNGNETRRVIVAANHTRLDGFVISKGQVRGKGAGVLCENVSPTVTNNVFISNKTWAPISWNPKFLHEIANDGGAIYCENGASPIIENNLFANNATEVGRGAAIAFHKNCNGRIANNIFFNNATGFADPMRSSDGGAISIFDLSSPVVKNNVILNNEALTENDGGGMFVALWSSPVIQGNIFVGNRCGDDAGALFVGGQEHRYDRPLDPLPAKDNFFIKIMDNVFVGNSNPSKNSGAMRFTMESRGLFNNNIVAHNSGIYFQRSEVTIENNIILDNFLFIETKEGLHPGVIRNNIIWGTFNLGTEATVTDNNLKDHYKGNTSTVPNFVNDWVELKAEAAIYHPKQFITSIYVSNSHFKKNELVKRIIKAGDRWGVVKLNDAKNIEAWGDFSNIVEFTILMTYRLR